MPHWPQAAGQFCDPLDICSRELVEDSLVFPERTRKKREDKFYLNCSDVVQPGRFLSLHLSHLVRHPTLKGNSTKKDLLGTHLAADVPPDTIVELIIRISVARIGGQVQLVHLGEGQAIVLADLAHRYVCYMSLRSG